MQRAIVLEPQQIRTLRLLFQLDSLDADQQETYNYIVRIEPVLRAMEDDAVLRFAATSRLLSLLTNDPVLAVKVLEEEGLAQALEARYNQEEIRAVVENVVLRLTMVADASHFARAARSYLNVGPELYRQGLFLRCLRVLEMCNMRHSQDDLVERVLPMLATRINETQERQAEEFNVPLVVTQLLFSLEPVLRFSHLVEDYLDELPQDVARAIRMPPPGRMSLRRLNVNGLSGVTMLDEVINRLRTQARTRAQLRQATLYIQTVLELAIMIPQHIGILLDLLMRTPDDIMGEMIFMFQDVLEEHEAMLEDEMERSLLMSAFSNLRTELTMTAEDIPRLRQVLRRLLGVQEDVRREEELIDRIINEPVIPYFVMERGAAVILPGSADAGDETDEDAEPVEIFATPSRPGAKRGREWKEDDDRAKR